MVYSAKFAVPPKVDYFFRGNYPGGKNKTYGYTNVVEGLRKYAVEYNLTNFPDSFYFIDTSLVRRFSLEYTIAKEYWDKHTSDGKFVHWDIKGFFLNASTITPAERNAMLITFKEWGVVDRLYERVPEIKSGLKVGKNHVYYVHCTSGVDRTGEYCGSYVMEYGGMTFGEALKWDIEIKGKRTTNNTATMNWYCYYLEKSKKMKLKCSDWSNW